MAITVGARAHHIQIALPVLAVARLDRCDPRDVAEVMEYLLDRQKIHTGIRALGHDTIPERRT